MKEREQTNSSAVSKIQGILDTIILTEMEERKKGFFGDFLLTKSMVAKKIKTSLNNTTRFIHDSDVPKITTFIYSIMHLIDEDG